MNIEDCLWRGGHCSKRYSSISCRPNKDHRQEPTNAAVMLPITIGDKINPRLETISMAANVCPANNTKDIKSSAEWI